jgi:hypothetical protein
MFVCVYSVFVLSCVGSGLATGWSLVQGVLPTVHKCKITEPPKEEAKARYGLQRHIRRRRWRRRRRTTLPDVAVPLFYTRLYWRYSVRMSGGTSAVVIAVFRDFLQSILTNART